jgi:hypothetical protein
MNVHRIAAAAAILLGAVFLAGAVFFSTGGSAPHAMACTIVHPKTGDLNGDGRTNSLDAVAIMFYTAELMKAPSDVWLAGADVNCDSVVNSMDAMLILQVDAGLITIRP